MFKVSICVLVLEVVYWKNLGKMEMRIKEKPQNYITRAKWVIWSEPLLRILRGMWTAKTAHEDGNEDSISK